MANRRSGGPSDGCDPSVAALLDEASPDALIAITRDGTVRVWNLGPEPPFGGPRPA